MADDDYQAEARLLRALAAAIRGRIDRRAADAGGGTHRLVARVHDAGAKPTTTGKFVSCHPVTVTGSEAEGATPVLTVDTTRTVFVDILGGTVPAVGDDLVSRRVRHRWVAMAGGVSLPCAQVCSRVQGCLAAGSGNIAVPGASVSLIQGGTTVATGTTVGQVTSATMGAVGSSYQSEPAVTITGDGTGATAVAIMNWAGKTVSGIFITNYGSGYSTATVAIAPPGGVGATATATAVISGQACLGYVNTGLTTIAVTAPPGMHYADATGSATLTCTSIVFTTTLVPVAGYTCVQGCLYPRSKTLTLSTTQGSCLLTWTSGQTWTGSITLTLSVPTYTTSGSPSGAFDCNNLTSQPVTVQFTYSAGAISQGWSYVKCCSSGTLPASFDANLICPNDTHGSVLNKIGITKSISLTLCPGPDPFLQSGTFPSSYPSAPEGACTGSTVPVPIPGAFTITL